MARGRKTYRKRGEPFLKKLLGILALLAGFLLTLYLFYSQGMEAVLQALSVGGGSLLLLLFFYPGMILLDTICWQRLFEREGRPSVGKLFFPRWVSDAVNFLIPSAQVGGDLVRARMASWLGVPKARALATVMADIFSGVATEVLFVFTGVLLLSAHIGFRGKILSIFLGLFLFSLAIFFFYRLQRAGSFQKVVLVLGKLFPLKEWGGVEEKAASLDQALEAIYARPKDFLQASFFRLAAWVVGAVEVYFALWLLKSPVSFGEAFVLESLSQAARHAAFIVPGGWGVQEASFLFLGEWLHIAPQEALALSIVKRGREILLSLPAFFLWQMEEGKRFLK